MNKFVLLREFADAKSCLKETVTQYCQFDSNANEILQSAFDDYNPFCNVSLEEGKYHCSPCILLYVLKGRGKKADRIRGIGGGGGITKGRYGWYGECWLLSTHFIYLSGTETLSLKRASDCVCRDEERFLAQLTLTEKRVY